MRRRRGMRGTGRIDRIIEEAVARRLVSIRVLRA
jgi:hypothetical protein